jgi:predicted MFS family arabinose efflux permease
MIRKATAYYLNSYKGLSREIWLLSFVNLVNRCGMMVIPFMMLYLTSKLGCSISKASIVMSLWGIGAFLGSYAGGKLTDTIGFYKIQLFSLFFGGIGFIVLGQLQNYYLICSSTFILAVINEMFRPANSAALGKYSTKENRMRSFTLMRLSFNLGWSVGAGIGGFVAHHSYELLFWIDGITNILSAVLLWFLLPPHQPVTEDEQAVKQNTTDILTDKSFVYFLLISIIFLCCFVQLFSNLPVFYKQQLHLQENHIGFLSAWNGILIVVSEMTLIYWIGKNWSQQKAVTIGVVLHAVAYFFAAVIHLNFAGAFIMMTIITLSEMFSFSVLVNYWMSRTNDNNRGQYAAYWTMTWAAAQTVGPFIGSTIIDNSSFSVWWSCVVILSLISAFLYHKIIQI